MKRTLSLLALLTTIASADVEWRTFENAEKTKSFTGRLVG